MAQLKFSKKSNKFYITGLTRKQTIMICTFIHSDMNQELVQEAVEDAAGGNPHIDSTWEEELDKLKGEIPSVDGMSDIALFEQPYLITFTNKEP